MVICPDCHKALERISAGHCQHCSWKREGEDGIWDLLSTIDRADPVLLQYRENYEQIATDDLRETIQEPEYLAAQTDRLVSYLGSVAGKDVCDLGLGQGLLLERLRPMSPRSLAGVDIVSQYLARYEQDPMVAPVIATAENLPFEEAFDVVVAADVLEHVLNIGDALLSIRRTLRPGGRLLLRVPLEEDLVQYSTQLGCPYRFVHLRSFTIPMLHQLLVTAGFEVTATHTDGFIRERIREPISRWPWLERRITSFLDRRYGAVASVARIDARLGRLLLKPVEVTVDAKRPSEAVGNDGS